MGRGKEGVLKRFCSGLGIFYLKPEQEVLVTHSRFRTQIGVRFIWK